MKNICTAAVPPTNLNPNNVSLCAITTVIANKSLNVPMVNSYARVTTSQE